MSRPRVLIAHTGGTIGMRRGPHGFEPKPGHLIDQLAAMPELSSLQLPSTDVHEFDPLLDSADMTPVDWVAIASLIARSYADFDGFVVLHGTDTLAYTASALSFLLEGLAKPVVVTGAQVPLSELRSDARENLIGALQIASRPEFREVTVCFGGAVMRGNRVTKVTASGFDAFESPNYPPLARLGVDIELGPGRPLEPGSGRVEVAAIAPARVAALRLFPGMDPELLDAVLEPPTAGLVLETYGAGNAPTRDPRLVATLADAVTRGVVVVNTTQCLRGRVDMSGYATGSALERAGVVSGADMTPEAALAKLICLLGSRRPPKDVRRLMGTDVRGELTS